MGLFCNVLLMIVCIFTNSISELCLHLTSQFCALLGFWRSVLWGRRFFLTHRESGSSPLWSCCGLCATGVAALCCIIKSHIHAPSFSFFLPVSLYQSRSQTGTSMNRGQRGKKWRCLCVQETPCPLINFQSTTSLEEELEQKNNIVNDL